MLADMIFLDSGAPSPVSVTNSYAKELGLHVQLSHQLCTCIAQAWSKPHSHNNFLSVQTQSLMIKKMSQRTYLNILPMRIADQASSMKMKRAEYAILAFLTWPAGISGLVGASAVITRVFVCSLFQFTVALPWVKYS